MSQENLENEETASAPLSAEQEAQLAEEAIETGEEGGFGKRTLGLERWVQLGYMVAALLLAWLLDRVISTIWYNFGDPDDAIVALGAVVGGIVLTLMLYRHKGTNAVAHEITEELSRVTWPTRKETSNSTIVVVVTSLIAALVIFLFDSVWSAVTDLVYKV